ncbi:serpin family protein [Promethearchaeum syntrophicum]|uniref:Serpin family protein n=1 Tax=Promethearchaeum syntrophicum TaxID=2594042 RepID=A0A5B9DB25_9ARCH|nr:serpin family protein [Candidatus Prometheoarchaeum syntrophicum]QEE15950.1 Serpin (serine protease inhibitor) [Candidatus Prometheoarchaeum syntrophicum]
MHKKVLPITNIFLIFSIITTVMFLFPHQPSKPNEQKLFDGTPINQFALEVYSKLDESEDKNIFFSPYSIFSALAMTYEGAKGRTAEEMKFVFHFPELDSLRPYYAALYDRINQDSEDYEVKTGNALWLQKDFPLIEDYTSRVENYYGAQVTNLDFLKESENSRLIINNYIEEQTNDKIKDLIPPGALDSDTKLVLTNAIYFRGAWQRIFDESYTYEENFRITTLNVVKTQMMHMKYLDCRKFNYAQLEDLQILELPYKGNNFSMLILLPERNLGAIELSKLNEYKNQMEETELDEIFLPKFEFDTKYFLKEILSSMGMPTAFSEYANFSGITLAEKLSITQVIHQAYIKVNEKGTEAAASTGAVISLGISPSKPIFKADHPFIFIIQEKETGNILFLGRVNDPSTQ